MNRVDPDARPGWRIRALLALAVLLSPLGRGDSYAPEVPGLSEARGGDVRLSPPTWERRTIHALIREASIVYGVDPALVRAVVWVESRYDPYAVSPRGARGLMQLTAGTARAVGVTNAFDPRQNVFGGVKYLSMLLKEHDGDVALALASYNAGPAAVRRFGGVPPYDQTVSYLNQVRRRFPGVPDARPPAPPEEPAVVLD